jgi:hypothetical protein
MLQKHLLLVYECIKERKVELFGILTNTKPAVIFRVTIAAYPENQTKPISKFCVRNIELLAVKTEYSVVTALHGVI